MDQPVIDRIADLAVAGMYEPGQYVRRGDLDTGPVTALPNGGRYFTVETATPNTDRQIFSVTIVRLQ